MAAAIPEERRLVILERVRSRPLVKPAELAEELDVSVETIRRDLVALEDDGLVRRVYGGVTRTSARAFEPAFEERRVRHLERKIAIGRLAATLMEPGDTVILDIGTQRRRARRPASAVPIAASCSPTRCWWPTRWPGAMVSRSSPPAAGCAPAIRPASARSANRSSATTSPTRRSWGSGGVDAQMGLTD